MNRADFTTSFLNRICYFFFFLISVAIWVPLVSMGLLALFLALAGKLFSIFTLDCIVTWSHFIEGLLCCVSSCRVDGVSPSFELSPFLSSFSGWITADALLWAYPCTALTKAAMGRLQWTFWLNCSLVSSCLYSFKSFCWCLRLIHVFLIPLNSFPSMILYLCQVADIHLFLEYSCLIIYIPIDFDWVMFPAFFV